MDPRPLNIGPEIVANCKSVNDRNDHRMRVNQIRLTRTRKLVGGTRDVRTCGDEAVQVKKNEQRMCDR